MSDAPGESNRREIEQPLADADEYAWPCKRRGLRGDRVPTGPCRAAGPRADRRQEPRVTTTRNPHLAANVFALGPPGTVVVWSSTSNPHPTRLLCGHLAAKATRIIRTGDGRTACLGCSERHWSAFTANVVSGTGYSAGGTPL